MLGVVGHNESERGSRRMCAGCKNRADRNELVRLVLGDQPPFIAVDLGRKLPGRGLSVHPRRRCVRDAVRKGGLSRALGQMAASEPESIERAIVHQFEQRLSGLLHSARRARCLEVGADAVQTAMRSGRGRMLLLTEDARGRREEICAQAERQGVFVASWGTKEKLGQLFGREELGVLLIIDDGIAREVARCTSCITALSEDE
jgi:predicted RNA-binding protein YlxR (DUF448 family)